MLFIGQCWQWRWVWGWGVGSGVCSLDRRCGLTLRFLHLKGGLKATSRASHFPVNRRSCLLGLPPALPETRAVRNNSLEVRRRLKRTRQHLSPVQESGSPSTYPLSSGGVIDPAKQIQSPGVHYFTGQNSFLGLKTVFYKNKKQAAHLVSRWVSHPLKPL